MRVLQLLDSPDIGGTEMLTLDLCRNAVKNGLNLTLVVTKQGDLDDEFRASGVDYYYFPRRHSIDLSLVFELKKLVKRKRIQVIHSHQAVDGLHAYLIGLITKVKTVMTFHGHIPSLKDDMTLKFLIPKMDVNVAVSKSFLRRLNQDIKFDTSKNFQVIYNGIDTKKFFKSSRNLRKELQLRKTDILLGMVGNFYNDGRDQLTICKALPAIFDSFSKVHFVFVGGRSKTSPHFFDDCYDFCKSKNILDKVHFVGLRTDINDVLNSLDVFVFSSNHDTFGIAVIEAMMAGVPTLVNDIPPLLEVTANGKYAKIFKSKCSDDLENKMREYILNKDERLKFGKDGKDWALNMFSIEKYIANLKNLYESLLRKNDKSY